MNLDFGTRLKRLCAERGLTVAHLAQKSGMSKVTIWELECQTVHYPRVDTLILLADVLDVSLDELVGRDSK